MNKLPTNRFEFTWLRFVRIFLAFFLPLLFAPFLAAQEEDEEDIYELSPFTIESTEDVGYLATSTMAGTRLRTNLRDLGSAIQVITSEFLRDTGVTDNESLLVYTTNTEIGSVMGNFAGLGDDRSLNESNSLLRPNTTNRVRGLNSADTTRNFFLTNIPWDNYNVERVDLQRGPNSILFGLGSPAGIISANLDGAVFYDKNKVEFRFGSWGSTRLTGNFNKVLLEDELAVRLAFLKDSENFRQNPAFENDERFYAAIKWEPRFLQTESAKTTFTANFEDGDVVANRPRVTPPQDQVTPWFTRLNQQVYNPLEAYNYREDIPGSGAFDDGTPAFNPSLFGLFGGAQVYFPDQNSGQQHGPARVSEWEYADQMGLGPDGTVDTNIQRLPFFRSMGIASFPDYALQAGLPFSGTLAPYKQQSLTDRSTFDFVNHMIEGPNKREWREFEATNLKLAQTFLNGKAGFELAYDQQDYEDRSFRPFGPNPTLSVDIRTHLPLQLEPNPNVGRPFIYNRTRHNTGARQIDREAQQATAFIDVDFKDFIGESWFSKVLGRHRFSGFGARNDIETRNQIYSSYIIERAFAEHGFGRTDVGQVDRELMLMSYLGPDIRGASSPFGLNIPPVTALQVPEQTGIYLFDSNWNAVGVDPGAEWIRPWDAAVSTQSENPANYVGFRMGDYAILNGMSAEDGASHIERADRQLEEIDSSALIWQGYFWDGALVPTYGYRKDKAAAFTRNLAADDWALDLTDGSYELPSAPNNVIEGTTESWSVVLHTDPFLPNLPANAQISLFYNESANFQPAAGRVDHFARPIDPPSGETQDYGFVVSAFDGKVNLKVNWYETAAKNASFNLVNYWFVGFVEAHALKIAKHYEGYLNGDPAWSSDTWMYRARDGQTEEEALALQRQHVDQVLNNLPPQEFWDAWGMDPVDGWRTRWNAGGNVPVGLTSTADTVSKGHEYELVVTPTENWRIMLNVAKQTAQNSNLAGSVREWIDARNAHWASGAGDIRMWWGGGVQSINTLWNSRTYSNYLLALQKEGTNIPEMRPWRLNLITNYNIREGILRGVNAGGSIRWQDKVGIGYPVYTDSDGQDKFRVDDPYWGPNESNVDLWLGYSRKILADRYQWRIQLNIRNAFRDDDLIPITVQGHDGSPGAFRIPPPTAWTVTNTLEF